MSKGTELDLVCVLGDKGEALSLQTGSKPTRCFLNRLQGQWGSSVCLCADAVVQISVVLCLNCAGLWVLIYVIKSKLHLRSLAAFTQQYSSAGWTSSSFVRKSNQISPSCVWLSDYPVAMLLDSELTCLCTQAYQDFAYFRFICSSAVPLKCRR